MTRAVLLALLLAMVVTAAPARAQTAPPPVMLVTDISGSMDEDDGAGTRKIDGAKLALLDYIGSVEAGTPVGLRTYPDQSGSGCNRGALPIPIGAVDPKLMSATIRKLSPDGDTPTAEAMRAAVADLKAYGATSGTLVIVSDGESTCADPCKAAKEIAEEGFDLDTLTVGFKISDDGRKELQCISDALEGRYLDIEKSDELRKALDQLGRPQIAVSLDGAQALETTAGGEPVEVTATVRNDGQIAAQDVIAHITFGTAEQAETGVDAQRPVLRLGNLEPGVARQVTWRVRASAAAEDRTVPFAVTGRALNASAAGQATGSLRVLGRLTADDAGAILTGPGDRIVILGDSYSAGEGADRYFGGTDSRENGCHRSPDTYLTPLFGEERVENHACSGAVTADVLAPNAKNPEAAQIAQLEGVRGTPRAVVMTIGGNDAGFPGLAASCIVGRSSCTKEIFTGAPLQLTGGESADAFVKRNVGTNRVMEAVTKTLGSVHRVLNRESLHKRRGGAAPILVPAYPLPVPLQGRSCAAMGAYVVSAGSVRRTVYLLDAAEIDFAVDFAVRLNGIVQSAVETARREHGVPAFFVPDTERAFQPGHTVCDTGKRGTAREPFARSVDSFNGGALNRTTLIKLVNPLTSVRERLRIDWDVFNRGKQELAHPNVAGYAAETQAILRWSRSRAAVAAVAFLKTVGPVGAAPTRWTVSDRDLGQLGPNTSVQLQGGTQYQLIQGGFAPGTPVRIDVRSRPRLLGIEQADDRGRIATRVSIPRDLAGGRHRLELIGTGPDGRPRVVRIGFAVDAPFRPPLEAAVGVVSAVVLLIGVLLTWLTGVLGGWRRRLSPR